MADSARILVIDDDSLILEFITDLLAPRYSVYVELDAVDALQLLRYESFDLLIVDLNLPSLKGEDAVVLIRALPNCRDLPILVMSADKNLQARVDKLAVQGVLRKPFDADRFLDVVQAMTERYRPAQDRVMAAQEF